MLLNQPKALNGISKVTQFGVCVHEGTEDSKIQLAGANGFGSTCHSSIASGLENGGEYGRSRAPPTSGDGAAKQGLGFAGYGPAVTAEEVRHGAVGLEGVAEPVQVRRGRRVRKGVAEGEEGGSGEGERVEGDEVDDVARGEGRDEGLEGGVEGLLLFTSTFDGFREREEDWFRVVTGV